MKKVRKLLSLIFAVMMLVSVFCINSSADSTTKVEVWGSYDDESSGAGTYQVGDVVKIDAGTHPNGYEFLNWEVKTENVELDDYENPRAIFGAPATNVVVVAVWDTPIVVDKTFTVEFETNGGKKLYSLIKPEGTVIELDKYIPEKTDCTFAGWYKDAELTKSVEHFKLEKNTTVYAKWVETEVKADTEKESEENPSTGAPVFIVSL